MYNKSKTYLLPLLTNFLNIDKKFMTNILNTYIQDDYKFIKNAIFLKIKYDFNNENFIEFEDTLITNNLFIEKIENKEIVIYIFKFPEQYLEDYNNFKNSKYSKIKETSKILILEFWTYIYGEHIRFLPFIKKIKQILYKDRYLKIEIEHRISTPNSEIVLDEDSELGEYVNLDEETFEWKKIIKIKEGSDLI